MTGFEKLDIATKETQDAFDKLEITKTKVMHNIEERHKLLNEIIASAEDSIKSGSKDNTESLNKIDVMLKELEKDML